MSRRVRLVGKKRGDRRTGSHLLGILSEAVFYASLLIVGAAALAGMLTAHFARAHAAGDTTSTNVGSWGFWLTALVVFSLMLIGVGGLIGTLLNLQTSRERRVAFADRAGRAARREFLGDSPSDLSRQFPNIPRDANLTNSPGTRLAFRLPASESPFWRLTLAIVFCLVSTGLAAVLVVLAIDSLTAWRREWVLYITSVSFLGLGAWSIYFFLRQLIVATSVGPTTVEISEHPFFPGECYQVFILQSGRMSIKRLEAHLVCEEEATYRQGTDVRRETAQVFSQKMLSLRDEEIRPGAPLERLCSVEIPEGAMHSFQSSHNAIRWKVAVRGRARGRPPFERTFPVVVHLSPPTPAENGPSPRNAASRSSPFRRIAPSQPPQERQP